ncbi:hypothetical protein PVAP13_8KG066784 [Panicum virgatum]|uniref:Uncharacterized protein n=1 Tax=Panicum virgatum TaxID=38727 RepID=A0A8T0PHY7_PANVG|nr:hypothetical protein PVAP13_8KG066784 [Panicum virgatum]
MWIRRKEGPSPASCSTKFCPSDRLQYYSCVWLVSSQQSCEGFKICVSCD